MGSYIKNREQRHFGTIDSKRWQELQKQGISPKGMYLLTELLVGRFRNAVGVAYIPFTLETLAKVTGMTPDEVAEIFKELQEKDILEYDEENDVIFLKEYWRHNMIKSTKHAQGACARIMELPDNALFPSMAKVFKVCVQEARAYDKQHPPGKSKKTDEPYEPVEARYKPVLETVLERQRDNLIDNPMDNLTDMTEYLDLDLDLDGNINDKGAFGENPESSSPPLRVEPGTKKQNTKNLLTLDPEKYPKELVKIAWRFVDTTTRILKPETWEREISKLLEVEPGELSGDKLSLEELDSMVTDFFNGTYSEAKDRSIVLFNDPEIRKHLTVQAGIRSYYDYEQ
jgi:hypothetical protein